MTGHQMRMPLRRNSAGGIFLAAIALALPQVRALTVTVNDFQARTHTSRSGHTLVYRLYVPRNYTATRAYPIMITLHGAGERGSNNTAQLAYPLGIMWGDDSVQTPYPCFVLSPQCPLNNQWVDTPWGNGTYRIANVPLSDDLQAVVEILDSLFKQYHLDTLRQYISGMSMGGYGTWDLAMRYPNRFAAIVPVCGAADTTQANAIRNLPTWAFHAADDAVVPVRGSREMINAMRARGGNPLYTEYPASQGVGHSAWVPAAANAGLVPWVFGQARAPVPVIRPRRVFLPYFDHNLPPPDALGRRNGNFPNLLIFPLR